MYYFTITISHSYGLSDYFKPEKKITGRNSYRSYDSRDRANLAFSKLFDEYRQYVEKHQREVILLNFTSHYEGGDITMFYLIYNKNNKVHVREQVI